MGKAEMMEKLRLQAEGVKKSLGQADAGSVWGEGNLDAAVVMVGEAPGAEEERLGHPFVGRAGKLFDEELERAGAVREMIYITNAVKCRPSLESAGRRRNRRPSASEIEAWRDLLQNEIKIVGPKVVLCLGAVAASVVIHPGFSVTKERGKWFETPVCARAMATFHPSYLARFSRRNTYKLDLFRLDLDAALRDPDRRAKPSA